MSNKQIIENIISNSFKNICKDISKNEKISIDKKELFNKYISYFTENKTSDEIKLAKTNIITDILECQCKSLILRIADYKNVDPDLLLDEYHQLCYYSVDWVKSKDIEKKQFKL